MKLTKSDEMEKYHSEQAAKYGFIFYTIALLVWSLFDFFVKGDSGWQMVVLLIGCAVYFWTRVVYKLKVNK